MGATQDIRVAAPLHAGLAGGPDGGRADWIEASDGLRLRAVHWPAQAAAGTVLMFPGRTEYAEKYGRVARDLAAAGLGTLAIDWRGQGLSDRLLDDPIPGHVCRFRDYQRDVAALVAHAAALDLPRPFHLLAHSMGGAIGLRALHDGLDVATAAFSAPMWGVRIPPVQRPVALGLAAVSGRFGFARKTAPGAQPPYVLTGAFADNTLTTDRDHWDWMGTHVAAVPGFVLGPPTWQWLDEALAEIRRLANMTTPPVPCLTGLGGDELIVDADAIRRLMGRWKGGRLVEYEAARHEVLMEAPAIRDAFLAELIEHMTA
ncbi:MAG: alpha/beta fold hydrolase [Paracoccaceae bacterium]